MSRRLNVDRMRRYVARTTPDLVRTEIDGMGDDPQREAHEWLDTWGRRMAIKHPGRGAHVRTWEERLGWHIVEARVEPEAKP